MDKVYFGKQQLCREDVANALWEDGKKIADAEQIAFALTDKQMMLIAQYHFV